MQSGAQSGKGALGLVLLLLCAGTLRRRRDRAANAS
jgi:MYXO-CTERM domain-containing protein